MVANRARLSPELRQSQVLDAARDVFTRSGIAGTTVKDIAAAAEVTETAVYHHFASKEEIFRKAVDERLHQLVLGVRDRMRASQAIVARSVGSSRSGSVVVARA